MNSTKRLFTLILACLLVSMGYGQEIGLVWPSSYRLVVDNPTMGGYQEQGTLYGGIYQKWIGMPDAPSTLFLGVTSPTIKRHLGIGGFFMQDQVALFTQTRASLFAAAHIHKSSTSTHQLSVGASLTWQAIGMDGANVIDVVNMAPIQGSNINVGLGLNYRLLLNSPSSWINIQIQAPQLFHSIELSTTDNSASLEYDYQAQYIFQANLQYDLGNGYSLSPSFRAHTLGPKDNGSIMLLDVGVGLGVRDQAVSFRLGYRNAEASMLYAGIGFRFGDNLDASLVAEPLGPFGLSAGAELAYRYGIVRSGPPSWYTDNYWKSKLRSKDIAGYFPTTVNQSSKKVFVNFEIIDSDDEYNPVENDQLALKDLFEVLDSAINEIGADKVTGITLYAEMSAAFNEPVSSPYQGSQSLNIPAYYQQGDRKSANIQTGDNITEGQLTAIKLYNIQRGMIGRMTSIPITRISVARLQIERDRTVRYNREIVIKLEFEK